MDDDDCKVLRREVREWKKKQAEAHCTGKEFRELGKLIDRNEEALRIGVMPDRRPPWARK